MPPRRQPGINLSKVLIERDASVCSFTSLPSGMFGLHKFLLNLSLMVDIAFISACLFNYVTFHVGVDFYALSVSAVHVGAVIVCLVILFATIYATYGLLIMNLNKLLAVLFIWIGHIILAAFFLIAVIIAWIKSFQYDPFNIQEATCKYARVPEACKISLREYLAVSSALVFAVALLKFAQIMCLRALCLFSQDVFQYVDCETFYNRCLTEPDRRRRQASRRAQRDAEGQHGANGDDSETDEEDVVVFERVVGRYPGGSTIKDHGIA